MANAVPPPVPGWREYWITLVGSCVLRLLALTLRFEIDDPADACRVVGAKPYVLAFWHNRLLLVPILWNRYFAVCRPKQSVAMTSTSRDGELIAQFINRFGVGAVRGSATRRGAAALRDLARFLRRGHDVGLTPDGSRGPIYEVKDGLVVLAQITGCPILPFSWDCSRAWRLKTWDQFIIPKPFSRVTFRIGVPHFVPRDLTAEQLEAERRSCEEKLMALVGLK